MPEQDHGSHGDEDPGDGLIVTNHNAASGNVTNTSAATMTTWTQAWVLPTSPYAYDHDLQFAKLFESTGASVLLRVHRLEDDGQRRT